jgi:hypothetical protein
MSLFPCRVAWREINRRDFLPLQAPRAALKRVIDGAESARRPGSLILEPRPSPRTLGRSLYSLAV